MTLLDEKHVPRFINTFPRHPSREALERYLLNVEKAIDVIMVSLIR